MGRVSGGLWILGALVGAIGAFLPGTSHQGIGWVLLLSGVVLAYGICSVTGWLPWHKSSLAVLGIGTVATIPVVGLAIYLTGGVVSYIEPLLVCSLLYVAFFFPPRWAWPLAVELVLIAGTPMLYDSPTDSAFLARYLAVSTGILAVTGVMLTLKRRLIDAEAHQREIAHRDSLTGVANRRAFDSALRRELARREAAQGRREGNAEPFALILIDLDDFKTINDQYGHPVGDAVLRRVAEGLRSVLRSTDVLARIGGDEFAIIALGSRGDNAERIGEALRSAVLEQDDGSSRAPVPTISIGTASYPEDGEDFETLLQAADKRLLAGKLRGDTVASRSRHRGTLRLL
jgi:diguanylate cyclase (GGDEF)-like protein